MMKKKKDEDAKPIEQEIQELQRRFRVLENDKRATNEDSQATIRKQRSTIEKLTRENRKMKQELTESRGSTISAQETKIAMDTMTHMTDRSNTLDVRLDKETRATLQLDEDLDKTVSRLTELRQEMASKGGINASTDNARATAKQIRTLENRLEKALQKFNEAISANRTLREQIDTLRGERVVFDDIHRKLENELNQKKKEMANIIEQANAAYEARDQAQAQMAALKQQADREHVEFEKEWKELGKLIENDKKMKEFMRTKVRAAEPSSPTNQGGEDHPRKKITQNAWDTAKTLVNVSTNQEQVTTYEEAFMRIQASTGICDIDELVANFITAEDTNFKLFKYNTELQEDIEKLMESIDAYKEEFKILSGSGGGKESVEKAKLLEHLEEKWNDIEKKAIHYEVKYTESQQTLAQVRTSIEGIFKRIGLQPDDLPSGAGKAISEANMMVFLGLVEERTQELAKIYDSIRESEGEDLDATRPARSMGASILAVNKLPSTVEDYSDDEDEEDDDDQRPFTVEELKAKTAAKSKKLAAKKEKGKQR